MQNYIFWLATKTKAIKLHLQIVHTWVVVHDIGLLFNRLSALEFDAWIITEKLNLSSMYTFFSWKISYTYGDLESAAEAKKKGFQCSKLTIKVYLLMFHPINLS